MMNVRVVRFPVTASLQHVYTAGVLLQALLLMISRIQWIAAQSYPIATDSFFYLEEFRAYQTGSLGYYTSYSPFFLVWGLAGRALSIAPEVLYGIIIVFSLFLLSYALFRGAIDHGWRLEEAVLLGTVPWGSDLIFYRHYAFPQQAFAVALALCAFLPRHRSSVRMALLAAGGAVSHLSAAVIVGLQVVLVRWRFQKVVLLGLIVAAGAYLLSTERLIFDFSFSTGIAPSLVQACTFAQCSPREWYEAVCFGLLLAGVAIFGFRSDASRWLLLAGILLLPIWSHEGHMLYRLGVTVLWIILVGCAQVRLPRFVAMFLLGVFFCGRLLLAGKVYTEKGLPYRLVADHGVELRRWIANPGSIQAQHGEDFRLRYAWNGSGEKTGAVIVTNGKYRGCQPFGAEEEGRCISLGEGWYLVRRNVNPD